MLAIGERTCGNRATADRADRYSCLSFRSMVVEAGILDLGPVDMVGFVPRFWSLGDCVGAITEAEHSVLNLQENTTSFVRIEPLDIFPDSLLVRVCIPLDAFSELHHPDYCRCPDSNFLSLAPFADYAGEIVTNRAASSNGHEATGVIAQVGNRCDACTSWSRVGYAQGLRAQGFNCDGYFQEYVVVDTRSAVKLPQTENIASLAPLCCAVIGAGGVGQMGIQYAKAMGLNVITVDINKEQLNAAKMAGADYTLDPSTSTYLDSVQEIMKNDVDAAVNFAPSKQEYDDMPPIIRWGGILMVLGVPREPLMIDPLDIIFEQYVIKTACNGTAKTLEECLRFSTKNNIKSFVENRQASLASKRTAEQAELSPIRREGLPLIDLQLCTPIHSQGSILLGTPIATSTRAGAPVTSQPGSLIASQEGVRLGTPIESPMSSPSIWPRPARERHSRPPVQLQQSAIERPGMEPRDFELPDPSWTRDLSHCPLSDRDKELLEKFWTELENDRMENCVRCQETWFDMGLKDGVCKRCIAKDKNKQEDEPLFFSAENQLDFGSIPAFLPQLTRIEEMLIARVHVFVNVMQVRGQQYKYRGHIVHFLRDVGKVYRQLPLLPSELDVILLRPPNASEHAHLDRQFRRQFRVRRRCLQAWLDFLRHSHPGYRDITVCQKRISVLPEDGDVLDEVAAVDVTDPVSTDLGVTENDDVEPDEVDQSAVPDLLPEDTEMEALHSHILGEERDEPIPVRPSTQHQLEMPDIRRTPVNEFNRSQALLSLAFPTLFPRGQADFVEPRLRPIKYADYIQHALRWHDGRFARHPTFRFVVFNTLMRAQARAKSSYFVKQHQQRQGPITRDDLLRAFQDAESAEAQQLLNSINRQTAQLRGTRPYWYRKRRELESYAYNLDCPGAFITFTPADLHWRSLYQHLPQFRDWQELPEQQRMGMSSKLLRDNPHIAAWHFYRRFGLFRDIVLKRKFNVTDYWNRYEWQGRGSSHCHGLFCMDGAPSVDLGNEHTRKEFVRIWGSHVTALNPEPARVQQQGEGNPLAINPLRYPLTFQWLSQVLNRCQRHHCSETYCLRKKKDSGEISCRFFFPRDTRDTADVVRRQGQSYFSFEAARNDSLMNHYNRCLSLGWLANIDISPCTSLQAVINYAAKYCSKMEKRTDSYASLGRQILPHVSHHNPLLSFASRLMNKLLAERDFSGQEICHILLNCELQEGTRVVRAVDCRPYEQQGRSLRLQGDHDDGEVVGIYDKYLSRPNLHEELTYLDFLANWNTSKRDGTKWTRWGRQAKPRVLYYFPRYNSSRQHDQYGDFCRVKLMLAHPHRDPNQLRKINGVEYASYASAAEFCYGNHQHPNDYYGTPDAEERRPDPDEFEQEYHDPDLVEEDWLELARQLDRCWRCEVFVSGSIEGNDEAIKETQEE
ncbi:hypothetical protein NM208_g7167 [Fusarium decemcellulare]|uniref:Uncharacterized protein n=1 Tax=Fusarium decemcellulare TaxID=57161 RepID=A0ACC1SAD1_9HYPO|nr:hypothetical protein NM208_g7167 [Fusarium decemcellulare]